ncbi:hypothetical protein BS78_07G014500 [Paspalum vaginatum]|nr:hypothetical protein BS78_07G014500 [Paspalum vaginatum]
MEHTTDRSAEEEDLLSKLPPDVLVSIVERLHLREAIRLAVLSKQWRCLIHQLPRLDLDADDFFRRRGSLNRDGVHLVSAGPATYDDRRRTNIFGHGDGGRTDIFSEANQRMVYAAAALLASRRPAGTSTTHTTVAMALYPRQNCMLLGRLLDDAVAGGKAQAAEHAKRALAGHGHCFRTLVGACPAAFGALTQLHVEQIGFVWPRDLHGVLAACPRLEELSLRDCLPPPLRTPWDVRHARLARITISNCPMPHGVDLVWCPRLERFAFKDLRRRFRRTPWLHEKTSPIPLSFGHVPLLTTVTLCNYYMGSGGDDQRLEHLKLSSILANTDVTDLRLNFRSHNVWVQPEPSVQLINVFRNLRNLKIRNVHGDSSLAWTMSMFILHAAPHLQELYTKLIAHDCGEEGARKEVPWEADTSFKHYSLTKDTISGCYGTEETIIGFILHLVEVAVNLKDICMRENATSVNKVRSHYCRQEFYNTVSKT